jgi:3-hydroxybutyryl-CoA dehydrogenase
VTIDESAVELFQQARYHAASAKRSGGMDRVGIIGAGQMGAGIAQVAAGSGYAVVLADRELAIAEKARDGIGKRLARLVEKGQLEAGAADTALARIQPSADYAPMAEAGLIVEAATEREEIKRAIFEAAGEVLGEGAILASNTSSIPITRMGAWTADPSRFIGLHFFNPVPVMALVEVIPGLATSEATIARTRAFAEALGKQVVLSGDEPGFVVNRVLLPMINEAVFALADFIGLDTCLEIMRVLHGGTGDPKYRPAPLLAKYVEAGWLGKKAGKGFYDYSQPEPVPTR